MLSELPICSLDSEQFNGDVILKLLPCHKAARQFVVNAAAAARNARASRGQKNATRIFALLFFFEDNFPKKIYEFFLRIYFRDFFRCYF